MRTFLAGLVLVVSSVSASALQQPNGTVIPDPNCSLDTCDPTSLEPCVGQVLACEQEQIQDPVASAAVDPQTFVPRGGVVISLLSQSTANHCRFGWYNADDDNPNPTLYPFLDACLYHDDIGELLTFNWCSDERWTGGRVGLFLGCYRIPGTCEQAEMCVPGDQNYCHVFYSETARNEENGASGYIYGIRYTSTTTAGRYYLAWEDWYGNPGSDFNDYVFAVDGLSQGCKGQEDCPEGFACNAQFRCVPDRSCTMDSDCGLGAMCEMASGLCVETGGSCEMSSDMDAGAPPVLDAGGPSSGDAGVVTTGDASVAPGDAGGSADARVSSSRDGSNNEFGGGDDDPTADGCSCEAASSEDGWQLAASAFLVALLRRRASVKR